MRQRKMRERLAVRSPRRVRIAVVGAEPIRERQVHDGKFANLEPECTERGLARPRHNRTAHVPCVGHNRRRSIVVAFKLKPGTLLRYAGSRKKDLRRRRQQRIPSRVRHSKAAHSRRSSVLRRTASGRGLRNGARGTAHGERKRKATSSHLYGLASSVGSSRGAHVYATVYSAWKTMVIISIQNRSVPAVVARNVGSSPNTQPAATAWIAATAASVPSRFIARSVPLRPPL
jgi:hypothetical protein